MPFILILLLLYTAPSVALDCNKFRELAKEVITDVNQGKSILKRSGRNVMEERMIVSASRYPKYRTREYKDRVIRNFTNDWYESCKRNDYRLK